MKTTLNIGQAIQNWLEQKRQRRALRRAIDRAYASFARQYPEWAAALFDQYFLTQIFTLSLTSAGQVGPAQLANAWANQMTWFKGETRRKFVLELTPIAHNFLGLLEAELLGQQSISKPIIQAA